MSSTTDILERPDQTRVRADLATFFGPNADSYLWSYTRMRSATSQWRRMRLGLSWPAFSTSFVWFFYRKMYVHGVVILLLPIVLGQVIGASTVGLILAIILARLGRGIYVSRAVHAFAAADDLALEGDERSDYLRNAGGVSLIAGVLAGSLYVCMLALAIFDLFSTFANLSSIVEQ
jgi:hypothetical protein